MGELESGSMQNFNSTQSFKELSQQMQRTAAQGRDPIMTRSVDAKAMAEIMAKQKA